MFKIFEILSHPFKEFFACNSDLVDHRPMDIGEGSELCNRKALSRECSRVDEEVVTIKEKPYSVFDSIMKYFKKDSRGYPLQAVPYSLPKQVSGVFDNAVLESTKYQLPSIKPGIRSFIDYNHLQTLMVIRIL